jgi:polysaccharide biosynthesis/export protein
MLKCLCQKINRAALVLALLAGCAGLAGCQSQPAASQPAQDNSGATSATPSGSQAHTDTEARATTAALQGSTAPSTLATATAPAAPAADNSPSMALREGDTVNIAFPGAPTLNTTQTIRRDGKITLEMVGEMKAAGLTPHELEQQLLKAYDNQLVVKEVSVTVQSAVFVVYVTGAVMRPGKITSDRVETPLEAVIEAGIDHDKANLKKVVVVRESDNGKTERFKLNLDAIMKGQPTEPFTLKSMDKIYVPEKFNWL